MRQPHEPFLAAVVQMTSTSSEEANWRQVRGARRARRHARRRARRDAGEHQLPRPARREGAARRAARRADLRAASPHLADDLDIHLLLGSFNERGDDPGALPQHQRALRPGGRDPRRLSQDPPLRRRRRRRPCASPSRRPSSPGSEVVVAETPLGPIGLSICYDLRFGELYRSAGRGRRRADRHPLGLHRGHRQGALGAAGARPRHRDPGLRARRRHSAGGTTTTACARATATR